MEIEAVQFPSNFRLQYNKKKTKGLCADDIGREGRKTLLLWSKEEIKFIEKSTNFCQSQVLYQLFLCFVFAVAIFEVVFGTHLQSRSATWSSSLVAANSDFMPSLGSHEQLASCSASSALGASLPQPPPPSPKSWASSNQRSALRAPSRSAPPIHDVTRPAASEIINYKMHYSL